MIGRTRLQVPLIATLSVSINKKRTNLFESQVFFCALSLLSKQSFFQIDVVHLISIVLIIEFVVGMFANQSVLTPTHHCKIDFLVVSTWFLAIFYQPRSDWLGWRKSLIAAIQTRRLQDFAHSVTDPLTLQKLCLHSKNLSSVNIFHPLPRILDIEIIWKFCF